MIKGKSPKLIGTLHGLRGAAALIVVIGHSISFLRLPLPPMAASMGVMLFFALSGFLMAHLYINNEPSFKNISTYLWARFARIYPLFALVCIFSALLVALGLNDFPYPMTIAQLTKHLLGVGSIRTIWTISTEIQFYLVFVLFWYFFIEVISKNRGVLLSGFLVLFFIIYFIDYSGERILVISYLPNFIVGMLVALYLPFLKQRISETSNNLILLISLIGFVLACFIVPRTIGERWVYHSLPLLILVGIIVASSVLTQKSFVGNILSSRPLFWLGEVSFGMYLLHRPVMYLMDNTMHFEFNWPIKLIIYIALLGAVSHASLIFIEKPARSILRQKKIFGVIPSTRN